MDENKVPELGTIYVFGPTSRKLQVTGLDWNEYSGELSVRMRPYEPAMVSSKSVPDKDKLGLQRAVRDDQS